MMRSILVALFFMLAINVAYADDGKVMLYKDFYYGMTKHDVKKQSGAKPCVYSDTKDALCVEGHMFAGLKWTQAFNFADEKLTHVTLVGDINDKRYSSSIGAVVNNKFTLVLMQTKNESCDIIQTYTSMEKGKAQGYISAFENRGLNSEGLLYAFIEEDAVRAAKGASSVAEVMKRSPTTMREVDIELCSDKGEPWLAVRFLAPKMAQNALFKQMEESKDSF